MMVNIRRFIIGSSFANVTGWANLTSLPRSKPLLLKILYDDASGFSSTDLHQVMKSNLTITCRVLEEGVRSRIRVTCQHSAGVMR